MRLVLAPCVLFSFRSVAPHTKVVWVPLQAAKGSPGTPLTASEMAMVVLAADRTLCAGPVHTTHADTTLPDPASSLGPMRV
jgi:hypothetical protein